MQPENPCFTSKRRTEWRDHQEKLKHALQNDIDATEFEHLAAALLSHLLDVPIVVAKQPVFNMVAMRVQSDGKDGGFVWNVRSTAIPVV